MGVKLGPSHRRKDRVQVFQNRVLRRIPGTEREEMAEGWRRLHNEELHNMYGHQILLG